MVYNIPKAFCFENKSINMPYEGLEIKLRFWIFAHARSSISNEALEIISELHFH